MNFYRPSSLWEGSKYWYMKHQIKILFLFKLFQRNGLHLVHVLFIPSWYVPNNVCASKYHVTVCSAELPLSIWSFSDVSKILHISVYAHMYSHISMYVCIYDYIFITVFYKILHRYVKRKIFCSKANPHIVIWVKDLSITFPTSQAKNKLSMPYFSSLS